MRSPRPPNSCAITPGVRVTIEGHCDEPRLTEYNLALGDRRAGAVKQYLVSWASPRPHQHRKLRQRKALLHPKHRSCWQQNRRGHFVRGPVKRSPARSSRRGAAPLRPNAQPPAPTWSAADLCILSREGPPLSHKRICNPVMRVQPYRPPTVEGDFSNFTKTVTALTCSSGAPYALRPFLIRTADHYSPGRLQSTPIQLSIQATTLSFIVKPYLTVPLLL